MISLACKNASYKRPLFAGSVSVYDSVCVPVCPQHDSNWLLQLSRATSPTSLLYDSLLNIRKLTDTKRCARKKCCVQFRPRLVGAWTDEKECDESVEVRMIVPAQLVQ